MRVAAPPQTSACAWSRGAPRPAPAALHPFAAGRVRRVALIMASAMLLSLVVALAAASTASADPVVTARATTPLIQVGGAFDVTLTGDFDTIWPETLAVVEVRGPGRPSAAGDGWPVVARAEQALSDTGGRVDVVLRLDGEGLSRPGAYLVYGEFRAADGRVARATTWLGVLSPSPPRLDVATVWPIMSGVRRDASGVFVDERVQRAVVPRTDAPDSIFGLLRAIDRYPEWRLTLAVEPLFLAQARDLADGFRVADVAGTVTDVPADDPTAQFAQQALTTLGQVAALETVQVIPGPYAMPALPILASEGWDDGWEQMQLGKMELQSTLQIATIPDAAYPPGLDLTTDAMRSFSAASIDYVVVKSEVARDLAEPLSGPRRPVRVRDRENSRLTLLFVEEELRLALAPPWDPSRFVAALAAIAAEVPEAPAQDAGDATGGDEVIPTTDASDVIGPVVAAPADEYALPPAVYLEELGRLLSGASWIRTRTLADVIAEDPPETRPIFLSRYGGHVEGLVANSYVEALREARAALGALEAATDSDRAPLDALRRLLFEAESRYWFADGLDPTIANRGLGYIDVIKDAVSQEFDKVDVVGDKSVIIVGDEGEIPFAIVNQTGYPLAVRVTLTGPDIEFLGEGGAFDVTLGVQENIFSVPVRLSGDQVEVLVEVTAGDLVVDSETVRIRSIGVLPVVAWVVAIVAILALIGWAVLRLR